MQWCMFMCVHLLKWSHFVAAGPIDIILWEDVLLVWQTIFLLNLKGCWAASLAITGNLKCVITSNLLAAFFFSLSLSHR